MNPLTIVMIVVFIVLIFMALKYYFVDQTVFQGSVQSAQTSTQIEGSSLATDGTSSPATNFAYSCWFYIDDWNYKYGHKKVIFARMGSKGQPLPDPSNNVDPSSNCATPVATAAITSSVLNNLDSLNPMPAVILGSIENNLAISLSCFPPPPQGDGQTSEGVNPITHTCAISNIPIQRWVNLLISCYGRTLDVYLNGKLVRTCLLPGIAYVKNNADVLITPLGGFNGWTSKFQYWPNSLNPQQAWNVYTAGYQNSLFGSSYQLKVSIMENGSTQSSYTVG